MSELQFAKQFLTTVDNKNTKYQPDHFFDPKTFPTRIPYTIPRLPHPPHPLPPKSTPSAPPAPGAEPSTANIKITLKSTRNPNLTLTIPSLNGSTTIQSLKDSVQSHLGGPSVVSTDKIKILLNKKPIPGSKKTVAEAFTDSDAEGKSEVELGVMVMGGAPDPPVQPSQVPAGPPLPTTAAEPMEGVETSKSEQSHSNAMSSTHTTSETLSTPQFWTNLSSFLTSQLSSPDEAQRLLVIFKHAYDSSAAVP